MLKRPKSEEEHPHLETNSIIYKLENHKLYEFSHANTTALVQDDFTIHITIEQNPCII